jgi:penicillin-binding protein 2
LASSFLPPTPGVEEPYRLTPQLALRVAILGSIALLVFAALFLRLWALQILSGDRYLRAAQDNQLRTLRLEPQRGAIVDRNGIPLVENKPGTAVELWPADMPTTWDEERAELRHLSRILDVPVREILDGLRARKGEPLTPVTVKENVGEDEVIYLYEHRDDFPGLQLARSYPRKYPQGRLAAQILGYVGEVTEDQVDRTDAPYRLGDKVGQSGVEGAFDSWLRGVPGETKLRVDSLGNPQGQLTPALNPRPGSSVRLTIDARLQRAAERALREGIQRARDSECVGCWYSNGGAVVALDPKDGSVLALASAPTFDPAIYTGRVTPQKLNAAGVGTSRERAEEKNFPALNRALLGYPAGSTFKPVTALAAMEEGLISPWSTLPCTGVYYSSYDRSVPKQPFYNWDRGVYTGMDLPTAIAASCDTYFYALGDMFYALPSERGHPLQAWASRFGFGQPAGLDVGLEQSGLLPTPEWRLKRFTKKTDPCCWQVDSVWKPGDSVQLAIGQKDLLVTPLQMARFYALLANGGKLVTPHLLLAVERPGEEGAAPFPAAPAPQKVDIDPNALDVVRRGLYAATHSSVGTSTGIFGSFPVEVAGKTGTAEKVIDPGDGYARNFDQAWWCGFGPFDDPKIVVCALIENGGHGGSVAAPAALRVFESYFHQKATELGPVHSD